MANFSNKTDTLKDDSFIHRTRTHVLNKDPCVENILHTKQ